MNKKTLMAGGLLAVIAATPVFAADRGDRANERLDARGERVNARLDQRGERIDQRLDNRGERIGARLDARSDRLEAAGRERAAALAAGVAAVLWLSPAAAPGPGGLEQLDLLAEADLDLVEEIEFYRWLAENDRAG